MYTHHPPTGTHLILTLIPDHAVTHTEQCCSRPIVPGLCPVVGTSEAGGGFCCSVRCRVDITYRVLHEFLWILIEAKILVILNRKA